VSPRAVVPGYGFVAGRGAAGLLEAPAINLNSLSELLVAAVENSLASAVPAAAVADMRGWRRIWKHDK
jgi:hypothetical protein